VPRLSPTVDFDQVPLLRPVVVTFGLVCEVIGLRSRVRKNTASKGIGLENECS
jgi:hypothetical protein